jgi:release factor glutamine methyltransferase
MPAADEAWTVGRLLNWTVEYLGKHGAENPRLDAEVLLAHARGCKRIELYTAFGEIATDEVRTAFRELVKRRADGAPVAYLVGHREFYSLDFEVNDDVLIPRPETESLVVALLDRAKPQVAKEEGEVTDYSAPSPQPAAAIAIADVGTGSGILAICAAKYLPQARVTAIDISPAALAVAKRNAERHGVADRIAFVEANLFANEPEEPRFDYIVSNPPYISTAEMQQLATDVREYEPHTALHAGETGTDVIAPLIAQAASRLKPGGTLLIEISPLIAAAVEQIIREQSALELGPTIKDLAGHARVVQAMKSRNTDLR